MNRTQQMKYLRECGLDDPQIGKCFGISRERVAQIIGRVRTSKFYAQKMKDRVDKVVELLEQGYTKAEINRKLGGTNKNFPHDLMKRNGLRYIDYAPARLERKRKQAEADLRKMLKAGQQLNTYDIQCYSMELYHRIIRVMGIKQWREYLGVE